MDRQDPPLSPTDAAIARFVALNTRQETVEKVLPAGLRLDVDEHGAPVTFAPAHWLVCFVPGLKPQFWHRFAHPIHKHVLMLKPNPDGSWTLFEPWWTRLLVRTISTDQAVRYLRWAAMGDVLRVEEDVPGRGSQFRGWSNCASLAAFTLGRAYAVWNPHGLFKRLSAEAGAQRIDAEDLIRRLTRRARSAGRRNAGPVLHSSGGLRRGLIQAGQAIVAATNAPRLAAAEGYVIPWVCRPTPRPGGFDLSRPDEVRTAVAKHLALARYRGHLISGNCHLLAGQFLSLLDANPYIQTAIGLSRGARDRDLEQAVTATVDVFLRRLRAGPVELDQADLRPDAALETTALLEVAR